MVKDGEEKEAASNIKKKEVTDHFRKLTEEWIEFMYPDLAREIEGEE